MGEFFFPAKYRKMIKALKKVGFVIIEGRKHTLAKCVPNGKQITVVRHPSKDIKREIVQSIADFVIEKGLDKEKFLKHL